MITLRTRESLCLDLDDCYKKIEELHTEIVDLKLASKILSSNLAEVMTVSRNRMSLLQDLQIANDELRNRRD